MIVGEHTIDRRPAKHSRTHERAAAPQRKTVNSTIVIRGDTTAKVLPVYHRLVGCPVAFIPRGFRSGKSTVNPNKPFYCDH